MSALTSAVRLRVLLTRTKTRALSPTPCAPIRCVNDKFFGDDGLNFVTQDELAGKLGLGAKTKTLLLLLQHCGRLKADHGDQAQGTRGDCLPRRGSSMLPSQRSRHRWSPA